MKALFPQYYRPTKLQFEQLWRDGLIMTDASALLNLYGYSAATRDEFMRVFEAVAVRLRLPHQFALEFHRNRPKAIIEHVNKYLKVERALGDLFDEEVLKGRTHPPFSSQIVTQFQQL